MSGESRAATADRRLRTSSALEWATRLGLVGYGFVHLLIAWVAIRVALGEKGSATGTGALAQLSTGVVGRAVLGALAVGFAALAVWQTITAAVGYRRLSGRNRLLMRIGASARTVTYGYFAIASAGLFLHAPSVRRGSSGAFSTARLVASPGGTALLGLIALTVGAIGIGLMVFGWRRLFLDQLDSTARSGGRRTPIVVVGQVGYVLKGAAFLVVGVLLMIVAVTDSPRRTGGLDRAFRSLLGDAVGRPSVILAGLGIGVFGLYLLVRARHLNPERLTS